MTLAKPQESFNDKIRNLMAGQAPKVQQQASLGASEQKQILADLSSQFASGSANPHF
jgi:hypothetical protein